jgi:hypothetical protein
MKFSIPEQNGGYADDGKKEENGSNLSMDVHPPDDPTSRNLLRHEAVLGAEHGAFRRLSIDSGGCAAKGLEIGLLRGL